MTDERYRLGVDIGTTFTAAATATARDGIGTVIGLGNRAMQVPSVLHIRADGSVLVGEAAEFRGRSEPEGLVREFKRRLGDSVPILVGGVPYSPQALTARILAWVVAQASDQRGTAPANVTLTHPAGWTEFKRDLLRQAAALADVANVDLYPEPAAAAIQYATRQWVDDGDRICVYDLGGGTFDVCVLTRAAGSFRVDGRPDGVDQLGGIDFDEAVFRHVLTSAGLADVDLTEMAESAQWSRLRRDCVEAKEALSVQTEAVIPVSIGRSGRSVRVTRGEFEDMIRAPLEQTMLATGRALRTAGVAGDDLSAFVLIGGSSRIPLVSEMLQSLFGRPVARDTHPKHDVAFGAALIDPQRASRARTTARHTRMAGRSKPAVAAKAGIEPRAVPTPLPSVSPPVAPPAPSGEHSRIIREPEALTTGPPPGPLATAPVELRRPARDAGAEHHVEPTEMPQVQRRRPSPNSSDARRRAPWALAVAGLVGVAVLVALAIEYAGARSPGSVAPSLTASQSDQVSADNARYVRNEIAAAKAIQGMRFKKEIDHTHVTFVVEYDVSPPIGGNHSQVWADCGGTVYSKQIANENAVHALEHGAVWITYRPGLDAASVATLSKLVTGQNYTFMSPYAGLQTAISLQAWNYQLFVNSATDSRITAFIDALRDNPGTTPEYPGNCSDPTFKANPSTLGHPVWQ